MNEVNLAIYLICHHGHLDGMLHDSRIIQRASIEKAIPLTYFFSGIQLDQMDKKRSDIENALWFDPVGAIQHNFINPKRGYSNAHKSELGIMPYNHIPLVHPFEPEIWGIYFDGILRDQILWSKGVAESKYGKLPVSFHPPDGIYSPAAAACIRSCGLDTVVIPGEHIWNSHDKGKIFWANDLRHVVRTNEIQLQDFFEANRFLDRVEEHAHGHNSPFVTIGFDSDALPLDDMVGRLCCIGDEAYHRRDRLKLVNVNAASFWNEWQSDINDVWGDWNNVRSIMNGNGDLSFIHSGRNAEIGHVVKLIAQRHYEGWNEEAIRYAKHRLWEAADAACRNGHWGDCLSSHYQGNINKAREALAG